MQTKTLFIAISAMDFLNLPEKLRLLKFMLSMAEHEPESALSFLEECSYGQIARISLRDPKRRLLEKSWKPGLLVKRAKTAALACQALGIKIELYGGKLYPPLLREICDPPFALYYRGALDVLFGKSVSVVGTRRLSPDGIKASRTFAYQAAQKGFCVVSGLAFGADGSAHQGAVDAFYDKSAQRVQTAAVLAGGVDNIFPPSHKGLAGKIIQNGGVVLSECPPCVPAEKWRFVQRNRIIAALSKATVVIQAPPGSKRRDFLKGGAGMLELGNFDGKAVIQDAGGVGKPAQHQGGAHLVGMKGDSLFPRLRGKELHIGAVVLE